jgi:hypothetical protein
VAAPIAGEDLGSWGDLAIVCWWRRKVYVGSSTAEDTVEREREKKCAETEKNLVFWLTLDPFFSSSRRSNPPLFIGGGRGYYCLHRGKISAIDSVGRDLKVGMVHCQICRKGCLIWYV